MTEPIIEIDNLHISFFTKIGEIPAVMDFSMKVILGFQVAPVVQVASVAGVHHDVVRAGIGVRTGRPSVAEESPKPPGAVVVDSQQGVHRLAQPRRGVTGPLQTQGARAPRQSDVEQHQQRKDNQQCPESRCRPG